MEVFVAYGREEELALTEFFKKFDNAYGALPMGPQITQSIVDFAAGIPFPPNHGRLVFENYRERMRHILGRNSPIHARNYFDTLIHIRSRYALLVLG
jgi:hypothetical protein